MYMHFLNVVKQTYLNILEYSDISERNNIIILNYEHSCLWHCIFTLIYLKEGSGGAIMHV